MSPSNQYTRWIAVDGAAPFEQVPTGVKPSSSTACPERFRRRLAIDTVHDGDLIPPRLLDSPQVKAIEQDGTLWRHYALERDWGANLLAQHVCEALGLQSFFRVCLARVVMDFNRFPGSCPPGVGSLDRLALNEPMSVCLDPDQKRYVLREFYDAISDGMERAIEGKLIKLSIHTYDQRNPSQTNRPEISILTRSNSYQRNSRLPYGLFDPLFPDVLVESSAKRVLRDRIALHLEKSGFTVEHNYPYCLPDGSLEIRCQPWLFFRGIKRRFDEAYPDARLDGAFAAVWAMLLNTNLRHGEAEILRGYLHRLRPPPHGREAEFDAMQRAYLTVGRFLADHPELVDEYRRSPERTSALSIEVRKDLVWRFEGQTPIEPRMDRIEEIATRLAEAINTYLSRDLNEGL